MVSSLTYVHKYSINSLFIKKNNENILENMEEKLLLLSKNIF